MAQTKKTRQDIFYSTDTADSAEEIPTVPIYRLRHCRRGQKPKGLRSIFDLQNARLKRKSSAKLCLQDGYFNSDCLAGSATGP